MSVFFIPPRYFTRICPLISCCVALFQGFICNYRIYLWLMFVIFVIVVLLCFIFTFSYLFSHTFRPSYALIFGLTGSFVACLAYDLCVFWAHACASACCACTHACCACRNACIAGILQVLTHLQHARIRTLFGLRPNHGRIHAYRMCIGTCDAALRHSASRQ